ncbi:class I SAM-dependent methyltransferase [Marinicrinis lubricantis]|uniref:Class I SAM-dependent methyltransferase n=1 Tax=Marinicrinis lubricantis TaxID=2086470 RepID=A0ABW1IS37_9BACL
MSDHYYSPKPSAEHDVRQISETIRDIRLTFHTDAGVFSKGGIDFGSRVLIESLEIPDRARLLDVGCGYGPIGLFAAKLAADVQVTMVDVNERALELAKRNAKVNGIDNVEVLQSDRFSALDNRMFEMIVTNPPIRAGKEVVHSIFDESERHLVPGGTLWIVIQKKQGAPSALEKLKSIFSEVEEVAKRKGYRIYKATKSLES